MDLLINTLPTDIQEKIHHLVIKLRQPRTISTNLMEEVTTHAGLLFNILKKTQINQSMYIHVRYTNVSLLAYYLVWILNDERFTFESNVTENVICLFNQDNEYIHNINFETFLIYSEIQVTKMMVLIRKCWLLMCVKKRLKAHRLLITGY